MKGVEERASRSYPLRPEPQQRGARRGMELAGARHVLVVVGLWWGYLSLISYFIIM